MSVLVSYLLHITEQLKHVCSNQVYSNVIGHNVVSDIKIITRGAFIVCREAAHLARGRQLYTKVIAFVNQPMYAARCDK